jgi:DNA-binding LacI/PurR family transcriptional regulator
MSSNRATAHDVARLAGVSQSTVSRTFSNNSRISQATRERVMKAAEQLGYHPNILARSLLTHESRLIGIVMAGIDTAFAPYVLENVTLRLQAAGYRSILFNVGRAQDADDLLPSALAYQVDGLIVASALVSEAMAARCASLETPLVLFNRSVPDSSVNSVTADNVAGGRLVAQAMIDAGVTRPAFITGRERSSTSQDRERGFIKGLADAGFGEPVRIIGDYAYEAGVRAARSMMTAGKRPDGIFAASDLIAMGVMDTVRYEFGLRVPQDVCVVGFDDIPEAARLAYQLATVRIDFDAMIDKTLSILHDHLETPGTDPEQVTVPVTFIERSSLNST